MQKRSSARRLWWALLLSHALAVQALLAAWSGAQAEVPEPGVFARICSGAQSDIKSGDTAPNPRHDLHHDCLSVCAAGVSALEPQQPYFLALTRRYSLRPAEISRDKGSRVAVTSQVFSARAPPTLV